MNENRQELINAFGSLFTTSEIKNKLNSVLATAKSNKKTELTQISKLKAQVKDNDKKIAEIKSLAGGKSVKKVHKTTNKTDYNHPALRYLMKYNSSNLSYALASYVRDGYIQNSYLHHMQGLNTHVVSTMIYMLFNFIRKQDNTIPSRVKASYLKHAIEAYRRAIYSAMEDYSSHDKMTQDEASVNHKLGRSIINYAFHIPYVVKEFKKSNHNQQHGTDKEVTPTNLFNYYKA